MGYDDWTNNGRLSCIDAVAEIRSLEKVQKEEGTSDGSTCYNFMGAAAVVGIFLSVLCFLG